MLLTKEVQISWGQRNRKHYEALGYVFTKCGDIFTIPVEHLSEGNNHIKLDIKCDCCGEVIQRTWYKYLKFHDDKFGDTCNKCKTGKSKRTRFERYGDENYNNIEQNKQTCLKRYGVENVFQSEEIKNKIKQKCLEDYGVEYTSQIEGFGDKVKQTKRERYGDENYNNQEKSKQTCFEHYGVEYSMQSEEVKEKSKQSCLEIYGVEYSLQSEDVRRKGDQTRFERYGDKNYRNPEKMLKTKAENGTLSNFITFSKPHQYTYGLLCGLYGGENVELEKPLGKYSLDCELSINDVKIDVEYNGSYWHNGNEEHDNKRRKFVLNQGYKVFNINSGAKFPTVEQIESAICVLTTTDTKVITIDLDATIDNQ